MNKLQLKWIRGKYFYNVSNDMWNKLKKYINKYGYIKTFNKYKKGKICLN